jgi:uncharacterized protein YegL
VVGDKWISTGDISCDGELDITIELDGETGIAGDPADIVLVLDRSGSMGGTPLADLKLAAVNFVEILDVQTDGLDDDIIGNGSEVAVVSFAGSASVDQALTSNAGAVKAAINSLSAGGSTNHEDAFVKAAGQLSGSTNSFVIMFTDGQTTAGGNPNDDALALRDAGTVIYAIGLGSVNVGSLNNWATDPDSEHVFLAPSSTELQQIFEAIGAAIVVPAATNIELVETVGDHFTILGASYSKGTATVGTSSVTWEIPKLGTEVVTLTLTIKHDNTQPGGVEAVNKSIVYSDTEGHDVTFPDPIVNVRGCAAEVLSTPPAAFNTVGDDHTVVATVLDDFDNPVPGVTVEFAVASGPSSVDAEPGVPIPDSGSAVTDGDGQAFFTYANVQASGDVITVTVPTQPNVAVELEIIVGKTWEPIWVEIDIKPGSFPNSFGAKSKGKIPVAVLGSDVFDVTAIDDASVRFGDAPDPIGDAAIFHKKGHFEDVNSDGYMDKVFHFPFVDTNLDPTDTDGCLGGEVFGLDFLGCDSVNIVPE